MQVVTSNAGIFYGFFQGMLVAAPIIQAPDQRCRGDIDLARFLCGDVSDVFARIATLKFDVEVEDTAASSLGFRSGALGQVEVAWTATGWQEAFWIHGTEGSLEVDNRVGHNVLIHRFRHSSDTTWADTDVARFDLRGASAHTQHIANFLAAISGDREVVCTGQDGLEAVRLVLSSYESAASGAPVALPLVGQ